MLIWKITLSYRKLESEVQRLFFNSFKVTTKNQKEKQFYRKCLLENDSFSKKHHCRNKQSVELKPHHFEKANMDFYK